MMVRLLDKVCYTRMTQITRMFGVIGLTVALLCVGCNPQKPAEEEEPPKPSVTDPVPDPGTPKPPTKKVKTPEEIKAEKEAAAKKAEEAKQAAAKKADQQRDKQLAEAAKALADRELEKASQLLKSVLVSNPSETQQNKARQLLKAVNQQKKRLTQLSQAARNLASTDAAETAAARNQLFESPADALPLVLKAVQRKNVTQVKNALAVLAKLGQPEKAIPAIVGVLENIEQEKNWPDAMEQLRKMRAPGAGPLLLKLATTSKSPAQCTAALEALSQVIDPPADTLVKLMPLLTQDSPSLPFALSAANHAVTIHNQQDILASKQKELAPLAARLRALMAEKDSKKAKATHNAQLLAVTLRQVVGTPIQGVRVVAFNGETATSPATAVLDKNWKSTDPKTAWQYPTEEAPGTITFALKSEQTIVGVRIWNLNVKDAAKFGWKEVAIYVGSTPADLATPVATVTLPQAPGKANAKDYSTTIPIPSIRGRHIRIEAKSTWKKGKTTGLTEVEILKL